MDLDLLRTRLAAALEPHDEAELALVFGSRTRDEAGPNSEVDVAVIGREVDTINLAVELTDAVGLLVDVVDPQRCTMASRSTRGVPERTAGSSRTR